MSKGLKTIIFTFAVVVSSVFLPFPLKGESLEEFYSRSPEEQVEVRAAAEEAGVSLERFLEIINPPSETSGGVNLTYLLAGGVFICSLVVLIAVFILKKFWRARGKFSRGLEFDNDALRKEHLGKLKELIEKYLHEHGCYPTEEEFNLLWSKETSSVMDPLEGQKRELGGVYSYYYSQLRPEIGDEDSNYYRLWCFLEGSEEGKEGEEGKYILESQ